MIAAACGIGTGSRDPSARPPASALDAAAQGKRRAFEEEAIPHLDTVYRVALRLSRDAMRAEDLAQETMLKAYRSWDRYQRGTNARAWLLTILRNIFFNEYHARQKMRWVDVDAFDQSSVFDEPYDLDPEGRFFRENVDEEVLRALERLPLPFHEAVMLRDLEGMSYAEISEVIGVPVGTVKSRLFRGRRELQRRLYGYAVQMGYIRAASPGADS